ncbi:MAG: trigger factor [Bacillota bacterium]
MEVTSKERDGNRLKIDVKVDSRTVDEALEEAYRKVVKEVSVSGFRKGKVPRQVLEAKFGEEILHKDALDILIPEAYSSAISEIGVNPIDRPDIEDYYIAKGEEATFTATVEVMPEVELGEYTDLEIEKPEVEIDEEEVESFLERMQDQHSQLGVTDKQKIEEGDTVIIDFTGTIDGEPFEGGSAEEFNLEIGSGQFIPGFEEQLIGEEVGTEVELDITFPDDYQADDLAGQEAQFDVTIKEIKEKIVPDLDDDFAKEVSDFDTIEEYREDIRERLKEQKKGEVEQEFDEKLFDAIAETAEVDIPETLVENELDRMLQRMSYSISQQGMNLDDYFEYTGMTEEDWRDQNYESAYKSVRNELLLDAVAEEEEIEVTEEEVEEKITEIAEDSERDPEEMKEQFAQRGQLGSLENSIKMEKTREFLEESNAVE